MTWIFLEEAAAVLFLLPLYLLLHKTLFRDRAKTLLHLVFASYLAGVLILVGFPSVWNVTPDMTINLIPFRDILNDGGLGAVLNLLLFLPLGIFLPLLAEGFRLLKPTLLLGVGISLFIEIAQLFNYRTTDINDLMTNTAGTLAGWLLAVLVTEGFSRWVLPQGRGKEVAVTCIAAGLIMFVLQPVRATWLWDLILPA